MLTERDREKLGVLQEQIMGSGRVSQKFMRYICRECIYDPLAEGTSRAQIRGCTVESCPLYPIRGLWS